MAYEKQTWACGDTITAEKMNHIEQGIADSGGGTEPLMIHMTEDKFTYETDPETGALRTYYYLDATLSEVMEAVRSGRVVYYEDEVTGEITMITYFSSDGITEGDVYTKSRVVEDQGSSPVTDDRPDAPLDVLTVRN